MQKTRVTVLTFRKASNIGEIWNPACCHGDKTVNSYIRGRLLESYCKESNDSDKIWLRFIFFLKFDYSLVECMTSSFG